jgi:hypothetical protein
VAWRPSRDPALGPRPCGAVPSLFSLALELLVRHISAVTSLWGVPDAIRSQIAAAAAARRKLAPEVALLFGADTPSELVMPDCHRLDARAMLALMQLLLLGREPQHGELGAAPAAGGGCGGEEGSGGGGGGGDGVGGDDYDGLREQRGGNGTAAAGGGGGSSDNSDNSGDGSVQVAAGQRCAGARGCLQRLELGACGRGFDDRAAAAVARAGPLPALRVLRLAGAYRLSDEGLLALLGAAPGLTELAVPSAPRLTGATLGVCVFLGGGGGE